MDDYIRRRDAVSRFSDLLMLELKGKRLPTWYEVYNAMQDVPSVQPEIIHCQDCKHWHINCLAVADKHGCDKVADYTNPNFYCGWAERREE